MGELMITRHNIPSSKEWLLANSLLSDVFSKFQKIFERVAK